MLLRCSMALLLATVVCACASPRDNKLPAQAAAAPQPQTPARSTYAAMRTPDYSSGGVVPAMAASRKINEQDCTKDIDLTAGNLRCR